MRYCRFETEFGPRYGEVFERGGHDWIERLLPPPEEDGWTTTPGVEEANSFEPIPFGGARLLAPVRPSKVVCIGRNYRVRGYTIVNDVTARDLQKSDGQWSRAKGFDTFCPAGPIVTDEIDPDSGLSVHTLLNGVVRQQGNTLDLIFPIACLLRYITAAMTLLPGDLIPTGTPAGVAAMKPGDVVEVTVQGIGSLINPISASIASNV
jgi:2-keto-4-pentenoate hydratase/2-oxohepta-3-ene-1,7-dioic acid hydratase in catechol pathway